MSSITMFECRGLEVVKLDNKKPYIKVFLDYDNIINCYADKLENDNKHLKINFNNYFYVLRNVVRSVETDLILRYIIYDKGKDIVCSINNRDIKITNILESFIWNDSNIYKLKEIFNCENESFEHLCKRVIEFKDNSPIVLNLLGEYIVYLLELDKKEI